MSRNIKSQVTERRKMKELWQRRETRVYLVVMLMQFLARGWFFGTYVLFLQSKGLGLFEANLVNVVFMSVSFLFDPLTGKLADKVGQRRVFVWGQVSWALGMLIYGIGGQFWHFAMGEAVSAIGHALMSEALESWLRNVTGEKVSHEAISITGSLNALASIPSAILGGLIGARWGLEWPWLIAGANCMVTAMVSWLMLRGFREVRNQRGTEGKLLSVREVASMSLSHPRLLFSLVLAFGVGGATAPFNMFWPPILKAASGETAWLGSVWIPISVFIALGSRWAKAQRGRGSVAKAVGLIGMPMIFPLLWPSTLPILLFFSLHEIGRGAIRPILFTYSNRHIDDGCRSTANSIRSAVWTLGGAMGLLVSGYLTKFLAPLQIWALVAVLLVALAIFAKIKE